MSLTIYTIGHSTHAVQDFLALLRLNRITAIADVRSHPYSRFNPQFNRETLKADLKRNGISYVFLGRELGARSEDPACYDSGKVQYNRLARTPEFQDGLSRVKSGAASFRIALMCAEKDPLRCHRTILVSRYLAEQGFDVQHILDDGRLEPHGAAIKRLKREVGLPDGDLFRSEEELEQEAYRIQGDRIAYQRPEESEDTEQSQRRVGT